MAQAQPQYSLTEEILHTVTHGAGLIFSIVGLAWMLLETMGSTDPWRVVASLVYGLSLVALFLASTVYHGLPVSRYRPMFKLLDHCAIYLLIAGTYTPILLVAMRNRTGWWLFAGIWTLAAAGIVTKLWFHHRYPRWSMAGYLVMGWLVVIAGPQVADAIGTGGVSWLVAGGLSYTLGAAFYMAKRMRYHHVIWHMFVLGGGACHFFAVARYVLPLPQELAVG